MIMNKTVQDNLLRLWKSNDIKNHDLAFQMLSGLELDIEDGVWLWEIYHDLTLKNTRRTTLVNFPNISKRDIIKGRILEILLQIDIINEKILASFIQNKILRLPYCTSEIIPSIIYKLTDIEHIIWQDGELKEIDEHIISLQGLKRIDFRRQPIEYIHPNVAELPLLEEVYLISTSFLPPELSERHDVDIYTDAPY